jgi:serine/threonine protein kinase
MGRKLSGAAFSREELNFLEAVATQVGIAMQASRDEGIPGRFCFERRLGVGGMGEVFLAWQLGPGGFERKVAVKRLLPHCAEEPAVVDMFLDEARVAAQLQHRNIAQIHEVGMQGDAYFMAMEYVDGPSVRQLLSSLWDQEKAMPVEIAVAIADAVLEALAYAHEASDARDRSLGVVHRDVTPRNVQLTRRGEVKLLDFGIARAANRLHITRTGVVKGSLPYMSPEQASGLEVDLRSDLYSLAAVLYEMLSGQKAYPEGPKRKRPTPLGKLRSDLTRDLEKAVERALALYPDDRFATAAEMQEALRRAIKPAKPATETETASLLELVRAAGAMMNIPEHIEGRVDEETATSIDGAAKAPTDLEGEAIEEGTKATEAAVPSALDLEGEG